MSKVHTTWTEATTNVNKAMIMLLSCLDSGKMHGLNLEKMEIKHILLE